MFAWLFLIAQLATTPYWADAEFKAWFEKAKVGDVYTFISQYGSCNSCSEKVRKISDTEVHADGILSCTVVNCNFGEVVKVK